MMLSYQPVTDLGEEELVDKQDGQATGGGAQDGVDDGQGDHAAVISSRYAALKRGEAT